MELLQIADIQRNLFHTFTPPQVFLHAEYIAKKYDSMPDVAVRYLNYILEFNGYEDSEHPDILAVNQIIRRLNKKIDYRIDEEEEAGVNIEEIILRKELIDFYVPKQLIDAIIQLGGIPKDSEETNIGIAFLDIADYSFLSKFLSPKENQDILNGLYSAFNIVLKRHGGYLNKIEGDSLMFHFGGAIDPNTKGKETREEMRYIATELFYTCIEMQRVCTLFNNANDSFLFDSEDESAKAAIHRAFQIIEGLRSNTELSPSVNAYFQIRIRIGANIGEVMIGNFGPDGAKHWDIIGTPVIEAKRMEATAPVGGLRISERFFEVLNENRVVDLYHQRFQKEAKALFGKYASIDKSELFKLSRVILKDKKNAEFITYSIQVNPHLPEDICKQVKLLLEEKEFGAYKIIDLLKYYRGNRYVTDGVEEVFYNNGIYLRKGQIFRTMYPNRYNKMLKKFEGKEKDLNDNIQKKHTLFDLFKLFGEYQDFIKDKFQLEEEKPQFLSYEQYFQTESGRITKKYSGKIKAIMRRSHFYNVVFPLVFNHIKTSILEYQQNLIVETITEDGIKEFGDELQGLESLGEIQKIEEIAELDGIEEINYLEKIDTAALVENKETLEELEEVEELEEIDELEEIEDAEELETIE